MLENKPEVLAMASVPCQQWEKIYDDATALVKGTIFPSLNQPFFKADDTEDILSGGHKHSHFADSKQQAREELMTQINQVSFVINDLTLFLDMHPDDSEGWKCFEEHMQIRMQLMKEFAEKFYPLTLPCIENCKEGKTSFCWAKGPVPWEGACV